MAQSPNLIHSDEYKFNNSIDSLEENQKPKLVQDTTTDIKLNMIANPVKITFYDNSEQENNDVHKNVTPEFSSEEESYSSSSSSRSYSSRTKERYVPPPVNNVGDIRYRKIELLRIFQELEEKGIKLSTRYNIHSNIEDMEQEYEILRSIQNKKNGIKLYKSFMMNAVSGIEFMNESYNPFDFHLKGWSEHVSLGIDDYDDVFAELYEKYKNTGQKMEPEIKLLLMIVASASSYHAASTMLKDTPGLSDVVKNNPHFVNNISKKVMGGSSNTRMQEPPEFRPNDNISGPDTKEFLERMRNQTYQTIPTPINTRNKIIDSVSEIDSTSKRRSKAAKKGGLNINI
jgi:hypothetical protein